MTSTMPEVIGPEQFSSEETQAVQAIEARVKGNLHNEIKATKREINFRDYSIFVCNSELTRIQDMQKLLNQAVKDYNSLKKKLNKTTDAAAVDKIMEAYPAFKPQYEKALTELAKLESESTKEVKIETAQA